jgi:L-Ala-D/L-Glu epimerase / N-acetyl-D-glutamate racemase
LASGPSEDLVIARVAPAALHDLRRRVLRAGNPDSVVDVARDHDPASLHFAGFLADRLVVSASFFLEPSPVRPGRRSYQLRFMATDFDVQGRGYGARVLEHARRELALAGAEELWANARDSALGFYVSTGWRVVAGSEHLSAETRLPHTVIYLPLTPEP